MFNRLSRERGGEKVRVKGTILSNHCEIGVLGMGNLAKDAFTRLFVRFVVVVNSLTSNGDVSSIWFKSVISKYKSEGPIKFILNGEVTQ